MTERFLKKLFPALHAQLCLHFFLNPLKPFHTWLLSYEDSYMFTTVLLYMLKEVTTLFDLFINISMGTSCFTLDGNSSQLWMSAHYPYATFHMQLYIPLFWQIFMELLYFFSYNIWSRDCTYILLQGIFSQRVKECVGWWGVGQ